MWCIVERELPSLPPQRSGAVPAQIIKVSVKVLYGWRGETFTEPFLYQAVSKILSENPLSSDRREEECLGSVEVLYGIELQTFTDPCCQSTSPAVNDLGCRVLQRGNFVIKSPAGYSHLVGAQPGNDLDGIADVGASVNVHRPIPYGTFTEPVEMSGTSKA